MPVRHRVLSFVRSALLAWLLARCVASNQSFAVVQSSPVHSETKECVSAPKPLLSTEPWRHASHAFLTRLSRPNHQPQDVFATPQGSPVVGNVLVEFASTKGLHLVADEDVRVFLDVCDSKLHELGRVRTNHLGRAQITIDVSRMHLLPGLYAVHYRPVSHDSWATSFLRVYEPGTGIIVSDIDETLSTGDSELKRYLMGHILPWGDKDFEVPMRDGASEMTQIYQAAGRPVFYLTGRQLFLSSLTARWMREHHFAPGHLQLAQDFQDFFPSQESVGEYKARTLQQLVSMGLIIEAAYGNAATDFYAYEKAGVPKSVTYSLGKLSGSFGTVGLGEDFVAHNRLLRDKLEQSN